MQDCKLEWFETRDQAFCNTHKRFELACVQEKVREAVDALNKIHDLAGQINGPNAHPNLGAIQDWCHRITGPCDDKKRPPDPLLVEVDSHLSALVHRYGHVLPFDFMKDVESTMKKVQDITRTR